MKHKDPTLESETLFTSVNSDLKAEVSVWLGTVFLFVALGKNAIFTDSRLATEENKSFFIDQAARFVESGLSTFMNKD